MHTVTSKNSACPPVGGRSAAPRDGLAWAVARSLLLVAAMAASSHAAAQPAEHINSIGMRFVPVPTGSFTMGSPDSDREADADEKPAHRVTLSRPFHLGMFEVTQAQWEAVMGSSPYDRSTGARSNPFFELPGMAERVRKPDNPVTVSWNEAQEFLRRLNLKEGHQRYRLPTEAEWEYAARGPDSLLYPWGSEMVADNLVFDQNSNNETADVGSKPGGVSWVGAYDMSGNVFEWTSTIYRPYPYDAADGRENPDDTASPRVYRSGWGSYIDFGVSAPIRFYDTPDTRSWFLGLRCARDNSAQ